jgi:hypothetical protein
MRYGSKSATRWRSAVKAVYLALAVRPDGTRDILGIWIEQTEGAKFWLKVFTDLKTRGCQDVLIAVTDGLKGMSEALAAVYPATTLQTCIVHLIRNSLDFTNWKERKPLALALRPIYTAASAEAAEAALETFERGPWGTKFPTVVASWRRAWTYVIPFFASPGCASCDLHDQRARERPCAAAEDHQHPRSFSQRRGGHEAHLAGAPQHYREMGARPHLLENRDESVRDPVSRSVHDAERVKCSPSRRARRARGRCRPCGRTERAHKGLGKPPRTRFPTASTRIILVMRTEG